MISKEVTKIMDLIEQYALDMSMYVTCKDDNIANQLKNNLDDKKAWIELRIKNEDFRCGY